MNIYILSKFSSIIMINSNVCAHVNEGKWQVVANIRVMPDGNSLEYDVICDASDEAQALGIIEWIWQQATNNPHPMIDMKQCESTRQVKKVRKVRK